MTNPSSKPAVLTHLWRWPVKGLGGEALESVTVSPGQLFPYDRAFALENGPSDFDAEMPEHVAKRQFVCMVHQPDTGRMTARYNEAAGTLEITTLDGAEHSIDPADPATLESLATTLVTQQLRGPLKLRYARDHTKGHGFTDVPDRWISIQNTASIERLGRAAGATLDPRRFRANMLVEGWEAFSEEEMVGETITIGDVEIEIVVPINRCRAIDVNPDSSQRDQELVRTLMGMRGKPSLGVYARIKRGGNLTLRQDVVASVHVNGT
ncbi:MAG: MOSC domain-containing protein [Pseudomonadota bacterium]